MPAPVPEAAAALAGQSPGDDLRISPRLAALLARRGVADREGARRYLNPSADQLLDPFLLAGMEEAVARLRAARDRGEEVAVVGDYDVDGVTSTAILLAAMGACGLRARPILPHRLKEGYGFQPVHVERARAAGCRLIVTADCGSSSAAAAEAALAAGIDVLVTDHHIPGCELPSPVLQINPRQARCSYPFPDLAAVGLSLKLAMALLQASGRKVDLDAFLRIACLGTIADLVPLHGENRVIAALGLAALPRTRSEGLKALIRQSAMKPPYSAADIGFRLGPRINAAGRLDTPEQALELLLTRDPKRANVLALELDAWNRQRQAEEMRVVEEAKEMVAARKPLPPVLVAWKSGWHKGVVGVAAGRLARDFHRPALLLAVDGEGGEMATGSGRSIPGIELHGFLARWGGRMERFGGHSQAVGLAVRLEGLPALQAEWEEAAAEWPAELLARRYEYEVEVAPGEIGPGLLSELAGLEPHGQGNPRPLVKTGPLTMSGSPRLFGNGHLAVRARGEDGSGVELVGWGWQARSGALAGRFEVLGHLEKDGYTGGPVLRLLDSRPAGATGPAGSKD